MNNELFFKNLVDSLNLPVFAVEISSRTDDKGYRIFYSNNSFKRIFDEKINFTSEMTELSPATDWTLIASEADCSGKAQEQKFFNKEKQTWYSIDAQNDGNGCIIFSLFDVTTKSFYNQRLKEAVFTDTLTMLPNRAQFNQTYIETVKHCQKTSKKFALIVFDLDNMKALNDSKGQSHGDRVLIHAAQIFQTFVRDSIKIFRFGDDEFAMLATEVETKDSAVNIADTVLESFLSTGINVSGGIALYPEDSSEAQDLIKFADLAMHSAKSQGKHRIAVFTPEMHKALLRKMFYKSRMPEAFKENEFRLFFQPQFDISTNTLRGFEALLRWITLDGGKISPEEFIPVAEESGFIVTLGEWIINTAFEFQKKWEENYDYHGIMSINVSPVQLKEPNFISVLRKAVEKHNINPAHIEIEITEGVLIEDTDKAVEILDEVKAMGFGLSLDDFGTGYSSLRYLQILPLTTLKIDKSFIQSITEDGSISADITNAIISMVTKMGLDTIAEGVEKNDQLALLQNLNCKNVQGFLRGKPMSSEKIESYLSGNTSALDKL